MSSFQLNIIILNQLETFTRQLSDKLEFHRELMKMKREQEEALFRLENEYQDLVREKRSGLLALLKQCNAGSSSDHALKRLHDHGRQELDAFLKIRVLEGWQEAQLARQLRRLSELGVPKAIFQLDLEGSPDGEVKYYRAIMTHLWNSTQ